MKQFYYGFRNFIRDKEANLIKIISITLGLFVGIIIFSYISFSYSYNRNYKDGDQLFTIYCTDFIGEQILEGKTVVAPFPTAVWEQFPEIVECATVIRDHGFSALSYKNQNQGTYKIIYADPFYFKTMGIEIREGNEEDLHTPDVVFISKSLAGKIYGEKSPVGETLQVGTVSVTVRGVFEDIPENCTLPHDILGSFITMKTRYNRYAGWDGDQSYLGYIRVKDPGQISILEKRVNDLVEAVYGNGVEDGEIRSVYEFQSVHNEYISSPTIKRMMMILGLLGGIVLIISIMNYILITLSSLPSRAKSIGIHKCNGAVQENIFLMSVWETFLIISVSLIVVALLIINFKGAIQELISVSLSAVFSLNNSWTVLLIILIVFFSIGIFPGVIFSNIPVNHVFRKQFLWKTRWKRPLIFLQFFSMSFIAGLLCIVLHQQWYLVHKEIGYTQDKVYYAHFNHVTTGASAEVLLDELRKLPVVESAGMANSGVNNRSLSGEMIASESGNMFFSVRRDVFDDHYLNTINMQFVMGRDVQFDGEVLVNEEFTRFMGWSEPLGKQVRLNAGTLLTIVGVVKDYPVQSYYEVQQPLLIWRETHLSDGVITVRLRESGSHSLQIINNKLKEMYPMENLTFRSLVENIEQHMWEITRFRNVVSVAFLFILLIMLVGLIGYVREELRRRTKEIAIRKVNGAETESILKLLSKDISWVLFPSICVGVILSYFIGEKWLDQFGEQITISIPMLILCGIVIFLLIHVCIVIQAWKVANSNPVESLRSE